MSSPHHSLSLILLLAAGAAVAQESIWIEGEDASATSFNRHGWYEDTDLRKDFMSPGEVELSDGDWLAHYASADLPAQASWDFDVVEGGTYTWWLRCNPYRTRLRWSLDGAPFQDLDLSDPRERINLAVTIDIRWLAWLRAAELDLSPGPHSVTLEVLYEPARRETQTGVDAMAFVNFPWQPTGVLQPGDELGAAAPDDWFVFHPGDDAFSPDSITDVSRLVEAPAGAGGPLRRVGAGFEFRDRPGRAVKLWGVNTGAILATEEMQRRQARLWRKNGVNLVRLHPVEGLLGLLQDDGLGGRRLDPAALDRLDRWFAVLKENGILSCWSLFYPHVVTTADGIRPELFAELPSSGGGKSTSGFVNYLPELQDAEWEWAEALVSHVNPLTGLAYAEDPALAIVEVHNEDSLFWHWPLNALAAGADYPLLTAELQGGWRDWLAGRYADDGELAAAWGAGLRGGDSLANAAMGIYGAWQMTASGPDLGGGVVPEERRRLGDFIRYLAETQRGYFERRRDRLRAAGFEGVVVTTAWRAGGAAAEAANLWCDDAGDAIDRHAYFGGGAGGHSVSPGAVNSASHLDLPGRGILGGHVYDSGGQLTPLYQVEDKPVVMSEWTMSPPNEWKAEAAPIMAFYGMGLQGWDASIHFAASRPRMDGGWPGDARAPSSYATETPHYLGQFPALALAVYEAHLQEGPLAAARRLELDAIFGGYDPLSQDLPAGGWPGAGHLKTPPSVSLIGRVVFKAEEGAAEPERLDWSSYVDPSGTPTLSATGELTWLDGSLFLVDTPRTQAVVGLAGALPALSLGAADIVVRNAERVSLILSSLDGRPLDRSEQVLITALARDRALNAEYSPDGRQLLRAGGPPLLLEPVQADIEFHDGAILSARAVDPSGVPTAVEVERSGNRITIDGRYRSYYYEVRREFLAPTCLERTGLLGLAPLDPGHDELFDPDGSGGWLFAADSPLASVPHVCPFASGDADPDPVLRAGGSPLLLYRLGGDPGAPIRLRKDLAAETLRISW